MLKVKFLQYKNVVLMEVLEQDESLRGKGELCERKGLILISEYKPELYKGTVAIRGSVNDNDEKIALYYFDTEQSATNYIKKATELINNFVAENKKTDQQDGFTVTIAGE